MLIQLSKIKGLDRRVRQQMSPEGLERLTASLGSDDPILGKGQVVPIKVRKNGDGYVLIYGHRRVQAAKAAGLTEIEATIEDVSDTALLTQSLIENVVREDMAAIDIAKALRIIIDETGATQDALGKRLGRSQDWVSNHLQMLDPELGLEKLHPYDPGRIDEKHVRESKTGTGGDTKLAARVLERAAKDELSTRDTRKVAEVLRKANEFGGAKAVSRVLSQSTARIIETAEEMAPRKPKPRARLQESKPVLFQWLKDPQTMLAEDAVGAIETVIALIAKGDRDPAGGKVWLRRLVQLLRGATVKAEKAIERLS